MTTSDGLATDVSVMASLALVSAGRSGPRFEAGPGDVLEIGRATRSGIPDAHMSARHFLITCDTVSCCIRDLGSTNGTFLNGKRITEATLHDGDRIDAGTSTFVVTVWAGGHPRLRSDRVASATLFEIVNTTPLAVGSLRWTDLANTPKLTVVLKGTFAFDGGDVTPTPKQLAIFTTDILTDTKPPTVRFESDIVPFKPCADVVLVGRAYAPGGQAVTQLLAGLRVGDLRYGVLVIGDRHWQSEVFPDAPTISVPDPFVTMDLGYERAFGGLDSGLYCKENHVGRGFLGKKRSASVETTKLPNLEDPRNLIYDWNTHPKPVGFGFYGRGWMPRLGYAGTYDEKYMKDRHPLPPADFSYRFFNGAHPDLQVKAYLRGDEEVELVNVCPDEPRMKFHLPGLIPKITIARWTVPPEQWMAEHVGPNGTLPIELPLAEETPKTVLDTLVFVPDKGVFYEVFRAVCTLSSLDSLEIARITVTA